MRDDKKQLSFALICASNVNRSMEAHALLKATGLKVSSFGVGTHVRLPGSGPKEQNIYEFGTPYKSIHDDLMTKDPKLYKRNGLLLMLSRNEEVKQAPQKWQISKDVFDVVLTFEERIWEICIEDFRRRETKYLKPCLIINFDVTDSHKEAAGAAPQALRLCQMIEESDNWARDIDDIIRRFQDETGKTSFYTVEFY